MARNSMQTASVSVALAGDRGNSVRKYDVTPAEVSVLRAVHGDDAIFDIEPGADIERGNREELERIMQIYGGSRVLGTDTRAVPTLYPGIGAQVPLAFDDLGLADEFYQPKTRANSKPAKRASKPDVEPEVEDIDELDGMTKDELIAHAEANDIEIDKTAKKADIVEAIKAGKTGEGNFGGALG